MPVLQQFHAYSDSYMYVLMLVTDKPATEFTLSRFRYIFFCDGVNGVAVYIPKTLIKNKIYIYIVSVQLLITQSNNVCV